MTEVLSIQFRTARSTLDLTHLMILLIAVFSGCSQSVVAAGNQLDSIGKVPEQPSQIIRVDLEHPSPNPRRWFKTVDDYEQDIDVNPDQRHLSEEQATHLQQLLDASSQVLSTVQNEYSMAQLDAARSHVKAGDAERYIPGHTDTHKNGYAAVVIARFDGPDTWLVRLRSEELPRLAHWKSVSETTRASTIMEVQRAFSRDF